MRPTKSFQEPDEELNPDIIGDSSDSENENSLAQTSSAQEKSDQHCGRRPGRGRGHGSGHKRGRGKSGRGKMFEVIMTETNLYREQCQNAKPSPALWTDVTVEEIMAFMGVVIAMGMTHLPEVFDYWRTEPILSMPWYSSIFSRTRFLLISRYLHLADNTMQPERVHPSYKLFKLGRIPEMLCQTFKSLYVPTRNLSIDEQMIGTKCR
ncbi:Hypothetical predicted protein, partial [Paramuricea clavata]